jgi:uncharacterized protein
LWMALAAPSVMGLALPIYEGEVRIAADQQEASDVLLRAALSQVLVRVSGDRSVTSDPGLPNALANARALTVQSSIRPASAQRPDATLVVNFDPTGVQNLLADLGRPVWPEDRQSTLVWLVIDDGSQKQIASERQVSALGALTQRAQLRGLPVQLPHMDAVDANRVNAVTLWAAPPQSVIAASQRYGANTMLVIRLERGNQWRARITLIDRREVEHWETSDTDSNDVLAAAIDGAADRLARRYALEPEGTALGAVQWWVDGLGSANDYARLMGYLRDLEVIRQSQVLAAKPGRVLLQLDISVGPRRLKQLLQQDGRLELSGIDSSDPALRLLP